MRYAIITGGNRGIGKAIVSSLATQGIHVVFTYRERKKEALALVSQEAKKGHHVSCVQLNLENRNSIHVLVKSTVKKLGKIDILINNAAMAQEKAFDTITDKDWDHMMAVNLRGPFALAQEVLPYMKEQGSGRIINIVSIGGQWGGYNQVHYAAAKAGLINLTRSLAKLYSKYGITANAVSPGLVETEMTSRELKSKAGKDKVSNIPMGRIANALEIASVVSFLCSENSSYVTGQTINVNGGMYFG